MSDHALLKLARSHGVICADGGFATHLEDALGASNLGDSPVWSASVLSESPHLIRQTHLDFLQAGAQIIGTATYQACHAGFLDCGIEAERATELMRLAIDLADQARSSYLDSKSLQGKDRPLIALSLGPYGAYLRGGAEYTGDYLGVTQDDLVSFHYDRLRIFADAPETWAKIDIVALETLPRIDEAEAILTALDRLAERNGQGFKLKLKPAYVSFVFPSGETLPKGGEETGLHTQNGLKALVDLLGTKGRWGLSGLGINCTKAKYLPALVSELTARLRERIAADGALEAFLFLEPDGGLVYDGNARTWSAPEDENDDPSSSVQRWQKGLINTLHQATSVNSEDVKPWTGIVLGGCCKATTSHISALRRAIDSLPR
ncbi:hypothetical protein A4X09_0g2983 [Tilletia walkeri]|uniref:Hcy-binding domain-containing protein n=1 Tax=Tilletia walkeri TaxID=117179 RepID=A0A8X7NAD7_9BASI|nr:hypothetical protein A4X09_0g2983 [Tilletia walkeri]